jgi:hypothetical protein
MNMGSLHTQIHCNREKLNTNFILISHEDIQCHDVKTMSCVSPNLAMNWMLVILHVFTHNIQSAGLCV